MRIVLLALFVIFAHAASAQPQPPQTAQARWMVSIVTPNNFNRYVFDNAEQLTRTLSQYHDPKAILITIHRNDELIEYWAKPQTSTITPAPPAPPKHEHPHPPAAQP